MKHIKGFNPNNSREDVRNKISEIINSEFPELSDKIHNRVVNMLVADRYSKAVKRVGVVRFVSANIWDDLYRDDLSKYDDISKKVSNIHRRIKLADVHNLDSFNEKLGNDKMSKEKKSYFHLRQSEDGRFSDSDTIAWIESDTTEEERIELANIFTNGEFSRYSNFYELVGPIDTPFILSSNFITYGKIK